MKKNVLILSFLAIALQSCSDYVSQYLCFDDVVYVSEFPKTIELEEAAPLDLDLMGCVDFFGNDSVLVFKMMGLENHWRVCPFPDLNAGMDLLKKGNGPDEFANMPGNEYFDGNDCRAWMSGESKMLRVDISESLEKGRLQLDTILEVPMQGTALSCAAVDDSVYFAVLHQYDSYRHCLFDGNQLQDLEHLEAIDKHRVRNDLNAMAAVRRYEASQKKVVEGLLHLNQINLYSLEDNTFAKTICVGEQLTDLGRIDDSSKKQWIKYYGSIITHPDYFAAIYFNASRKDFFAGKIKKTDIQFFNWDGEPLLDIRMPFPAESFFIHKNKDLYVLSTKGEEERLYKYDLGDLLTGL